MIKSIEINNFKRLKQILISPLSRITLFGGKNNAGKTSVLEAMFMFCDRANPNMFIRQHNWRGMQEMPVNPEALWAPFFRDFNLENEIEISAVVSDKTKEKMKITFNENFNNKYVSIDTKVVQESTNKPLTGLALEITYENNISKDQKVNYIINSEGLGMELVDIRTMGFQAVFLSSKGHLSPNENAVRFGELDVKGKADSIIDFLQIVEPSLTSLSTITLSNNQSMLYGNIGIGRKLPITYMGDGISRLLSIILAIASSRNGVVFIDEIENGIHYSVMPKIWESISKASEEYNCQVIATTHSYECLKSLVDGLPTSQYEDFQYIRLENNLKMNRTIPKVFRYEVLKSAIDRGWEVR